jgi:two-component system sensor histidine kinase ResE
VNRRWRPIGLQGWLVVAFVGVGMIASLAILLVLLPTLESAVRNEQAPRERDALERRIAYIGQNNGLPLSPSRGNLNEFAAAVRADVGGEVRVDYRSRGFVQFFYTAVAPREPALLGRFPTPDGTTRAQILGGIVWATAPLYIEGDAVGSVTAAHAVRGVPAELAIVRRRVFIAMVLVLSLASLLGFALSRIIGQRIARLAQTASTLAAGDLSARAPQMAPAELDTLSESLNGMASRLEDLIAEITTERDRDRAMLGSLAEGVVSVAANGEVTVANRAAERYLGLAGASAGPPVPLEALPPELIDAVRAAMDEPEGAVAEHEMLVSGIELDVLVARLGGERAAGAVVTLRDVTEERRLERARRDLVANVSHELKTPIAALKGFLELLEGGGVSERHRGEFIASMSQETARLERLVEEQLQLARLDSGGLPLEREEVDLAELAQQTVAPRAVLAARDGVALVRVPPPAPVMAHADPARIEQVLLILLDNALRHTPAGGRVEVSVRREAGAAALAVRDTGTGIPYEEQPFVFDRFYRGDASREGRSAGLGLAIARGLALAHGGAIDLVSTPGEGSTFTLRLPLADPAGPTETLRAAAPAGAGRGGRPGG